MFECAEAYDTMIARVSELIPHDLTAAKKIATEFYLKDDRLIEEKIDAITKQKFLATVQLIEAPSTTANISNSLIELVKLFDNSFILHKFGLEETKKLKSQELRSVLYSKMVHGKDFYYSSNSPGMAGEVISYILSYEPLEIFESLAASMVPCTPNSTELAELTVSLTTLNNGWVMHFFSVRRLSLCRAACINSDYRVSDYLYRNFYSPCGLYFSYLFRTEAAPMNFIELICSLSEDDKQGDSSTTSLSLTTFSPQVFLHLMKTEPLFTVPKISKRLKYHLQSQTSDSLLFLFKLFLLRPNFYRNDLTALNCGKRKYCKDASTNSTDSADSDALVTLPKALNSDSVTVTELVKSIQKIGQHCEELITLVRQVHSPASVLIIEYFL